ncbi:MAG: hypothetical protein DWQ10_17005 [Calditrichaeota bacterium]|nr:MAG: hypothetical protein DWQ10_17005 [Calditrichota bacterium]
MPAYTHSFKNAKKNEGGFSSIDKIGLCVRIKKLKNFVTVFLLLAYSPYILPTSQIHSHNFFTPESECTASIQNTSPESHHHQKADLCAACFFSIPQAAQNTLIYSYFEHELFIASAPVQFPSPHSSTFTSQRAPPAATPRS